MDSASSWFDRSHHHASPGTYDHADRVFDRLKDDESLGDIAFDDCMLDVINRFAALGDPRAQAVLDHRQRLLDEDASHHRAVQQRTKQASPPSTHHSSLSSPNAQSRNFKQSAKPAHKRTVTQSNRPTVKQSNKQPDQRSRAQKTIDRPVQRKAAFHKSIDATRPQHYDGSSGDDDDVELFHHLTDRSRHSVHRHKLDQIDQSAQTEECGMDISHSQSTAGSVGHPSQSNCHFHNQSHNQFNNQSTNQSVNDSSIQSNITWPDVARHLARAGLTVDNGRVVDRRFAAAQAGLDNVIDGLVDPSRAERLPQGVDFDQSHRLAFNQSINQSISLREALKLRDDLRKSHARLHQTNDQALEQLREREAEIKQAAADRSIKLSMQQSAATQEFDRARQQMQSMPITVPATLQPYW